MDKEKEQEVRGIAVAVIGALFHAAGLTRPDPLTSRESLQQAKDFVAEVEKQGLVNLRGME